MKSNLPYGTWPSPVSAAMVGGKSPQVSEPLVKGGELYYLQSRPEEKNRSTIMRYDGTESHSLLERPINVRSKVHEYGGGAYTVGRGYLYFVLADDQRIYRLDLSQSRCTPEALTADTNAEQRFADLEYDQLRNKLVAVCEDHSSVRSEALSSLVSISLEESTLGEIKSLTSGCDFYSNPRLSPDGQLLCWISWMHPNMPWDSTRLTITRFDENGGLNLIHRIGNGKESLCQPRWSPDGKLFVISDRNEWWNLYHCEFAAEAAEVHMLNINEREAEFATPPWTFNMSSYAFLNARELLASHTEQGVWYLRKYKYENKRWQAGSTIDIDNSVFLGLSAENNTALYIGANGCEANHVKLYQQEQFSRVSKQASDLHAANISRASALKIPSGNEETHAFYYPPSNSDFQCETGLPPAIVICHGGPTGSTDTALNLKIQFWTSRGFAVCDVNYRGSTGYGKAYRQRLYQNWGLVDVDDLCATAEYLVQNQLAAADKLIVKGSSAGGFSVLAALASRNVFNAGVSLYGIADLEILTQDTHKFEARYLDTLIGPYPKKAELYKARSPINFTERFNCPLLVFQGLEDKVVPPNQAELIVQAVKENGQPVAYRTFADEGHGFRNMDNIRTMLNDELYFYCKVFSLPLPESCESDLHIYNL